jgi:acetylornithine deacetylase/succinyl-diaminopimelate desuccinylase-like protein
MTDAAHRAHLRARSFAALQARQTEIEAFIRRLVEVESPSGDEKAAARVVDLLGPGCETARLCRRDRARRRARLWTASRDQSLSKQSERGTILLVGHTDTVHSRGSLSERPWRREAGKIYGPGIFDMKANCALAIEVLRTLVELKVTPAFGVTIALTCDEEVGSLSGWPLLEQVAKFATDALCVCDGAAGIRWTREDKPKGNRDLRDQGRRKSGARGTRTGERRERDSRTRAANGTTARAQSFRIGNHSERRRGPWRHAIERCRR